MSSIVIAVTGASAQILAERSIEVLLKANQNVEVILSKGDYEVWKSENEILIPVDPLKQERFW